MAVVLLDKHLCNPLKDVYKRFVLRLLAKIRYYAYNTSTPWAICGLSWS